jgi:hypothetical protein
MAISKIGYSETTKDNYVIDAGAVYKDLTFDATTGAVLSGTLLGATSGGSQVVVTQTMRKIEVDGVFADAVGQTVKVSESAEMTVNFKEITANLLKIALNGAIDSSTNTKYDIISTKGSVDTGDYMTNIALVGVLTGEGYSGDPVVFVFENALSISGLNFKTVDNAEAVIPVTFRAHATALDLQSRKTAVKIYFPKKTV